MTTQKRAVLQMAFGYDAGTWFFVSTPYLGNVVFWLLTNKSYPPDTVRIFVYTSSPSVHGGAQSANRDNLSKEAGRKTITKETSSNSDNFEKDGDISMVCLFDHEEAGSQSSQEGARAPMISEAVRRISTALSEE
jgi:hypothetical protein